MSDYPPVAIVLLTYDRMETAAPVLRAALANVQYPGPIHVHIADDGSPDGYLESLLTIAARHASPYRMTYSNSERRGYGASYNLACQAVHPGNFAALMLEDDWLLTRPLDLVPLVRTLQAGPARCLRLGYLSSTASLYGEVLDSSCGKLLLLDGERSHEHHIFAGHARFEMIAFQQALGPWTEGLRAGETEFEVCKRPESRRGIAWPLDVSKPYGGDLFREISSRSHNQTQPEGATDA